MGFIGLILFIGSFALIFYSFKIQSRKLFIASILVLVTGLILATIDEYKTVEEFKQNCYQKNGEIAKEEEYNVTTKVTDTTYFCIKDRKVIDKK